MTSKIDRNSKFIEPGYLMKILLTGFEPFDGSNINPSAEVVQNFSDNFLPDHQLIKKILPVDNLKAVVWIDKNIPEIQPDIILHLGEASSRSVITIEKVAINWMDFRIPDNSGIQIKDQPVIEGAPTAYFSTLPISQIIELAKESGIPIDISLTAGAYLCNQVFYTSMHLSKIFNKRCLCGFIHLPPLPIQVVNKNQNSPSMDLETSIKAIELAIKICLGKFY